MNASNTSGMINALQNLDGTPYNPPEEVSSTFPKRNWTQTVATTQDVTQCSTYYSAAPSNSPVPPYTPSHQSQQPSSSQYDPLEANAQELKAAWESDAQKAYRQKALSFENYGLTTDPQGYLVLLYSNSINTIEKPFSACRNLRSQKIVEHSTQKEYIKYTFDTPTREHKEVIVDAACNAVHRYTLLQDHGFVTTANFSLAICAELIARYTAPMLNSVSPLIKYSPGWYSSKNSWGFQESNWVDLNTVLFSFTLPSTSDMVMYQLLSLYAVLQGRLSPELWIRRPFCVLTHNRYLHTDLSLDESPRVFKKELESLIDRPLVWIRAENINFNESSSAYSRDKNYQALMNSMQSDQRHPVYIVVSQDLTPRQRIFCLPVQNFSDHRIRTNSLNSIGDLIKLIIGNSDAFEAQIDKVYTEFFDELGEDCPVRQEISVLAAIAAVVQWYFSIRDPSQKGVVARSHNECLTLYIQYWERFNGDSINSLFRNALYAARRSDMICFRPLEDVDSSFDCQNEILYDDTYYYTSTALLKKIIKVQLRSYMPSDVLNRLKTAGVLSGSVPKTLTFAPNESKDFRFRTLLRSSLHQPGSRDLVEI